MSVISDFYKGTTKQFTFQLSIDGEVQSLTNDTVKLYLFDDIRNRNLILSQSADLITSASDNTGIFDIESGSHANINAGTYLLEIRWFDSSSRQNHIINRQNISVLDAISTSSWGG